MAAPSGNYLHDRAAGFGGYVPCPAYGSAYAFGLDGVDCIGDQLCDGVYATTHSSSHAQRCSQPLITDYPQSWVACF